MTDDLRRCALLRWASALACAVLASGCALFGGQTGQEDSNAREGVACEWQHIPVERDAVTDRGFSAAEVETLLAMPVTSSLLWHRMNTRSELTLQLLETRARYIAREVDASPVCPDVLGLDARVSIRTADGLLDEQLDATITADAADVTSVRAELPMDSIAGGLTAEVLDLDLDNWRDPKLVFYLGREATGIRWGEIRLDGGDPNEDDNSVPVSAALAEIPAP